MSDTLIDDDVAETLLIPLYARAVESKRPSPIISDPTAITLVQQLPYDFSNFKDKPSTSVGVAIRARFFDEKAKEFIKKHPNGVIVNVGCGLDTRLQRLAQIAHNTPFYSLDIDEVIALRQKWLPPLPNETLLSASMFDKAWLETLHQNHPNCPFLLLVEGVMMYFTTEQNRQFLTNVADTLGQAYLYFDCPNVFFSTKSNHHSTVKYTKARFAFGIDDPKILETWDNRWQYLHHHYFCEFKETWQMGKVMGFLMHYVPLFKKSFMMIGYQLKK